MCLRKRLGSMICLELYVSYHDNIRRLLENVNVEMMPVCVGDGLVDVAVVVTVGEARVLVDPGTPTQT